MSFTGFSSDEDGSIIYDGKKFIVTNPRKVPANFNPGKKPVIGLPADHPSLAPRSPQPPGKDASGRRNHDKGGRDGSRDGRDHGQPFSSEESLSGFPQDIEWTPDHELLGLVTFMRAAIDGRRDSSEDKATAIGVAMHAADPAGAACLVKVMTGAEPEDEQGASQALVELIRRVGLVEHFESESWYTTGLGASEPLASSAAETGRLVDPVAVRAEAGDLAIPELSRRLRFSLAESYPGEWDSSLADKSALEKVILIPRLMSFIQGFDEASVDWADFTLQESLTYYYRQIAGELLSLSQDPAVSSEQIQAVQSELDRAADLLELAKPIALDDSAAYREVFDVGFEGERSHVQSQLSVIYEYLDIPLSARDWGGRSTSDLKYELYSLLNYSVIPLRGGDQDTLAAQLYRSYTQVAGVSPQSAVERLQGTYREPDVLGFLFVMGMTMVFEPLDWALSAVDVIDALSEGDIESAVGNFILGAVPFASSRMDDAFRLLDDLGSARLGGQVDIVGLLPARSGWNMRQTEALTQGKIVDPGSKSELHQLLDNIDTRIPDERHNVLWYDSESIENTISGRAENEIGELFKGFGYNVVIKPTRTQLELPEIGYTSSKTPDFIIEGKVFDAYAPSTDNPRNIASSVEEKLKSGQADRIIVDISESKVTEGELAYQFIQHGDGMLYNLEKGTDLRELWIRKNDWLYPFLTVENNRIRMLWP